ncbi:MAG TPA: gamma-glutamyltransferase [Gaiellaceae bacterium]|nr:gamma-glutamyltransferase [Gaiellaceae bacterium]
MRRPTIVRDGMVATSHPLATRAGVRALERGGNAVDAALAAAAMLCVAEPGHTGIGGDLFAQLWWDRELVGLNGSGRSPGELPDGAAVTEFGPTSVTVPGTVRAWADLAERFGRLGLDAAIADAVDAGERGIAATERVAQNWAASPRAPYPAPAPGEIYRFPELAATLRRIASEGPDAFYRGRVAEQIAAVSWLGEADLAAHASEWVEPLRLAYRGVEVCELPPNGQGAAALIALALLDGLPDTLHSRIEVTKLALADAYGHFADAPFPEFLLDPEHLAARRALVSPERALDPEPSTAPRGGTTYLCAVDGDRNAISLIQSTYYHWGSGVLAGETGIMLQNRAWGFTSGPNELEPGKRPFHTIIPGMLLRDGELWGPFGVMGGPMQAQGHLQLVHGLVDRGLDPQRALDEPRFRVDEGRHVEVEPGLAGELDGLRALGHDAVVAGEEHGFGVGQCVLVEGEALVGGSDGRGDGHASGM